ncbi:Small nuclear ribonucleoprotein SmD3b [Lathyrus oleraceus]|uniref:Small nuclear ribonucleoprotein Sm D3 n=1 Tax=Pisum sativum TaxID=3888 RepID=A0A9D4VJZ4_PEA|nr:Small nuclear ribonucleoprotein SmD3b [Pisum sativum]
MSRSLGIPVKLLHEASGHVVTVELKSGELYRGNMIECEDNWNCQLESITYTAKLNSWPAYPGTVSDAAAGLGLCCILGQLTRFEEMIKVWARKDGKTSQLEHVFIRGSKVRFMVIPDMLKNAPMFKRLDARIKGKGASLGVGRGRAVAMRAKAQAAGRGAPPGRGVPPVRR